MFKYIKVPIICGNNTCPNYDARGFYICHFLKMLKRKNICTAFNKPINIVGGRYMRCNECMKAEQRSKNKNMSKPTVLNGNKGKWN